MADQSYILISGANGNLGKATIQKLTTGSKPVVAVDRGQHHLSEYISQGKIEFKPCDVSDEAAATKLVDDLVASGKKLDTAILLVGGYVPGNIEETNGETLRKQYTANFESCYFLARPLLKQMKEIGQGRFVLVGAKPGLNPALGKHSVAYALSKSLIFRLAEIINEEGTDTGITATVIVPGTIDTPQNRASMPGKNYEDWVKPEHIANVIAFAVSDEARILREPILKVYNNS